MILSFLDSFDFLSTEEKNQLKAELLTARAMTHFEVTLYYCQNYNYTPEASHRGVVYNTEVLEPGVDFPSRITITQTYEHLKRDLDQALLLFTDQPTLPKRSEYEYFNKLTTQALYARMALQMNDWGNAIKFANEVLSTSAISLTTTDQYEIEWELDEDPSVKYL